MEQLSPLEWRGAHIEEKCQYPSNNILQLQKDKEYENIELLSLLSMWERRGALQKIQLIQQHYIREYENKKEYTKDTRKDIQRPRKHHSTFKS